MDFIEHARRYTEGTALGAMIIKLLPVWFRPILAPIIMFPNRRVLAVCKSYAVPIIEERMEMMKKIASQSELDWRPPVSFSSTCRHC